MKSKRSRMIRWLMGTGRTGMVLLALGVPVQAQAPEPPRDAETIPPELIRSIESQIRSVLGQSAAEPGEGAAAGAQGAAAGAAQPAATPDIELALEGEVPPGELEPAEPPDIHVSPQGRVEMHVRDLDLGAVLQLLSIQSQRNIIASNAVSGKVTANLYNVTFDEALTAIL